MESRSTATVRRIHDQVVGRERELELILAAVRVGRDMVLIGPPGTSKTTLLRAALDLVTRPGARRRAAEEAPQSVAALDWERIHDRLEDALREAIGRPLHPAANESIYHLLPD